MSSRRSVEFLLVVCLFPFILPVILTIGVLIRVKLGSPVFFSQTRPGLNGRPFLLHKFRTMLPTANDAGKPLSDEKRLTRFGKVLRATSLDELPEMWNVLKGDMSIVGPRPLLMQYLDLYTPEQARRHEVKPGLTGWAQIHGRNNISWEDKFRMDVWYVDHRSLGLDVKIILKTALKVLKREGISQEGQATVEYFQGTKK